jgi:hypothetical protein
MLLAVQVPSSKSSTEAKANGLEEPVGIFTLDALTLGTTGTGGVGVTAVILAFVVALLLELTTGSTL